jgi:tetratricopeptide (TPR) repeat protein
MGTSARHQLAVVYLEEAKTCTEEDARRLLSEAEPLFQKAYAAWKREASRSWRQGYPLRRLGQLYAMQARYAEALTHFLDALEVFSCHHVLRLVEATKKDIVRWFSDLPARAATSSPKSARKRSATAPR